MRILVTRPAPSGELLCQALAEAGHQVEYFPTLKIAAVSENFDKFLMKLHCFSLIIFTSPQAVIHSASIIQHFDSSTASIIPIGQGTSDALKKYGVLSNEVPEESSSEGVLAMSPLREVRGKNIALIKGEGGRELLAETLKARGAIVEIINVYRRYLPDIAKEKYLSMESLDASDIIIATSLSAVKNLILLTQKEALSTLFHKKLLVMGKRMVNLVETLGFDIPAMPVETGSSHEIIARIKAEGE